MNNSFVHASNGDNRFSRKFGNVKNYIDPYISGYMFSHFSYLPPKLGELVAHTGGTGGPHNIGDNTAISKVLATLAQSVTIPGATVNTTEMIGLGGIKWAVPTSIDVDTTVSVKYLETSGLPIHAIMHGWVRLIRDYRAGVSALNDTGTGLSQITYSLPNYTGTMYYWTTKPDGKSIEYYSCISGMFPRKDPTDLFSGDIAANDKVEIDIDYNANWLWHEDWVRDNCVSLAEQFYGDSWAGYDDGSVIGEYGPGDGEDHNQYT